MVCHFKGWSIRILEAKPGIVGKSIEEVGDGPNTLVLTENQREALQ